MKLHRGLLSQKKGDISWETNEVSIIEKQFMTPSLLTPNTAFFTLNRVGIITNI
jgi:hypothetical protein